MNAEQALALAGAFQSAALVQQLANGKTVDEQAQRASLDSIFMLDADDTGQVFGGLRGMRVGLESLVAQLDSSTTDLDLSRMVFTMLHLERKLARQNDLQQQLRQGIGQADRQRLHFDVLHTTVSARLGELYEQTLSHLRPRIMVNGDAALLQDGARVARIRANLLAGIRATVLWRQLGGRKWHLLLRRKHLAALARGLLSRLTLEYGQ